MRVGFDIGIASLRGTHIAIYDYAINNLQILGNESIVFYEKSEQQNTAVLNKFKNSFELIPYESLAQLNSLAEKNRIDRFYLIKSGEKDSYCLESVPNLVHAVFPQSFEQMHGDIYAFVSNWLSNECSNNKIPYVPHMIDLPDHNQNFREKLNIPLNATVFAYYGGADSFNLAFVRDEIQKTIYKNNRIYFIFMNIPSFVSHPQAIFLPGSSDLHHKVKFINTSDAMIHARGIGESFGIACGEFSIRNKPVITYALSPQRSHIQILGSKALLYRGPKELTRIFTEFDVNWSKSQDWDCYSSWFSPLPVMSKFNKVFLESDLLNQAKIDCKLNDLCNIQLKRLAKKGRSLSRKYYLYFH